MHLLRNLCFLFDSYTTLIGWFLFTDLQSSPPTNVITAPRFVDMFLSQFHLLTITKYFFASRAIINHFICQFFVRSGSRRGSIRLVNDHRFFFVLSSLSPVVFKRPQQFLWYFLQCVFIRSYSTFSKSVQNIHVDCKLCIICTTICKSRT